MVFCEFSLLIGKFSARAKWQIPLQITGGIRIIGYEKAERILKALASKSRLQILGCIQKDISNLGEIARELKRHRSTIEKHLRVLLSAKIVEKAPSLSKGGQLTIRYKIRENAKKTSSYNSRDFPKFLEIHMGTCKPCANLVWGVRFRSRFRFSEFA